VSDFGFMLAQSPGNIGFEAAPFKLLPEYVEVMGGIEGAAYAEFRRLFREGFEAARKHCDRIVSTSSLLFPVISCYLSQTSSSGRVDAERLVSLEFAGIKTEIGLQTPLCLVSLRSASRLRISCETGYSRQ
jgi:hypothetical protein